MKKVSAVFGLFVFALGVSASVEAQELVPIVALNGNDVGANAPVPEKDEEKDIEEEEEAQLGFELPNSNRLRVRIDFMGAYTFDPAQANLGLEKQGRVGYVNFDFRGKLSENLGWVTVVNPFGGRQLKPACGEDNYVYPNTPPPIGPKVECHPDGNREVDDYRSTSLDPFDQMGMIREAYVEYTPGGFGIKAGYFILPIGLDWQKAGSLTAKDATHIQLINSQAYFGIEFSHQKEYRGRNLYRVSFAGLTGGGNGYRDYNYGWFNDLSLARNSWPAMLLSAKVSPFANLDFGVDLKRGHSGSKIERLPYLFGSKRYDYSTILSAQYRPAEWFRVFGEKANYRWGLVESSAELLEMPHLGPIDKDGYYVGAEVTRQISQTHKLGVNWTWESLLRDDTRVHHFAHQGLYRVTKGARETNQAVRVFMDVKDHMRVGFYINDHRNPFPWISGIAAVSGERAFQVREAKEWGIVVRVLSK